MISASLISSFAPKAEIVPVPPPVVVETAMDKWIDDLGKCESHNTWDALNPVDLDGTPSKGRFQFKDSSFTLFSEKYDIPVTSIWNGDEQEQIVRKMVCDEEVDLTRQFPDCIKNHVGMPPACE